MLLLEGIDSFVWSQRAEKYCLRKMLETEDPQILRMQIGVLSKYNCAIKKTYRGAYQGLVNHKIVVVL